MDTGIEAAFMTGRFVFMNNSFSRHVVNNRYCFFISRLGLFQITSLDGVDDFFDVSAHHRTVTDIARTMFLALASAFFGLNGICQRVYSLC